MATAQQCSGWGRAPARPGAAAARLPPGCSCVRLAPIDYVHPCLHPHPAHRLQCSRRRRARGAAGALDGDSSSACAGSEDCGSGAESDASVDDITAELGEGLSLSARFPVRLRPHLPPGQAAGAARRSATAFCAGARARRLASRAPVLAPGQPMRAFGAAAPRPAARA